MSIVQRVGKTRAKSKAEFVRRYPKESVKEIVKAAASQGMKIGETYVYNVRAYDKKSTRKKRAVVAKSSPAVRVPRPHNSTRPSSFVGVTVVGPSASPTTLPLTGYRHPDVTDEDLLRAVASELGLAHSVQLLEAERVRVRAVVLGGRALS